MYGYPRDTIHLLAANTSIVACYNYTGTPYVKNQLLPKVVYAYGLRESMWDTASISLATELVGSF